jgi:hypothetical protein
LLVCSQVIHRSSLHSFSSSVLSAHCRHKYEPFFATSSRYSATSSHAQRCLQTPIVHLFVTKVRRKDNVGPVVQVGHWHQRGNVWDQYHRDPWYVRRYLIFASVFRRLGYGIGVMCGNWHTGAFFCGVLSMHIGYKCYFRVKQTITVD